MDKIGEVTVEVKAGLSVDEHTFRTCLDLIAIHAKNKGFKGMLITLHNDNTGCGVTPISTDEGIKGAIDGYWAACENDINGKEED